MNKIESLEEALACAIEYVRTYCKPEQYNSMAQDMKKWNITVPSVKEMAEQYKCCNQDCNQGRNCPERRK